MGRAERRSIVDDLFAAVDARDTARFLEFLTPDATFRFGSAPEFTGREAIREAVDGFFGSIAALEHAVTRVTGDGTTLVCLGDVTYTLEGNRRVTLPFAVALEFDGAAIRDYRIYADMAPLQAG